jgi:DNA-binding NarL/FixJ family response regulator
MDFMDGKTPVKIAIVDDDSSVRRTLELLISRTQGLQLAGSFEDAHAALKKIPAAQPQVVLMDIRMSGLSGVECARQLKRSLPAAKIIMVPQVQSPRSVAGSSAISITSSQIQSQTGT